MHCNARNAIHVPQNLRDTNTWMTIIVQKHAFRESRLHRRYTNTVDSANVNILNVLGLEDSRHIRSRGRWSEHSEQVRDRHGSRATFEGQSVGTIIHGNLVGSTGSGELDTTTTNLELDRDGARFSVWGGVEIIDECVGPKTWPSLEEDLRVRSSLLLTKGTYPR